MNDKCDESVEIDEVKIQETIARVVKGEGSEGDKKFIEELEKLTGKPIISGKLRMLGEKIKANKEAMVGHELGAMTKLAENESEKQQRLSELDVRYQKELSELNRRHQIIELHATTYSKSKWFIGILIAILGVLILIYIK